MDDIYRNVIKENGIAGTEGTSWIANFRKSIKSLSEINVIDYTDSNELFPETKTRAVYACGDEFGASYYAHKHNTGKFPMIVKFQADIEDFYVDGNDFLYTVFQLWDTRNPNNFSKVRKHLVTLLGDQIRKYFDPCETETDHKRRIIYCNYACRDNEVKLAYLNNGLIIKGRHNTHFKSSFVVKAPIIKEDIIAIYTPDYPILSSHIDLQQVLA